MSHTSTFLSNATELSVLHSLFRRVYSFVITPLRLTAICDCLENVTASTSHNPVGLHSILFISIQKEALASIFDWIHVGITLLWGRATAQAVSRWLPTAAARVRARVWSSGICGGQSGAGGASTSVSPANLHSTNFSIIIITRGRYNRPFSG
jgi:hypothetical protein